MCGPGCGDLVDVRRRALIKNKINNRAENNINTRGIPSRRDAATIRSKNEVGSTQQGADRGKIPLVVIILDALTHHTG